MPGYYRLVPAGQKTFAVPSRTRDLAVYFWPEVLRSKRSTNHILALRRAASTHLIGTTRCSRYNVFGAFNLDFVAK
jgi:hypothetical protein